MNPVSSSVFASGSHYKVLKKTAPRFGIAAEAPQATPQMHEFINLDEYAIHEQEHAGWVKANAIKKAILTNKVLFPYYGITTECARVLEIGCSSGTSTLPIVDYLLRADATNRGYFYDRAFEGYDAVDIDQKAIAKLAGSLKQLLKNGKDPKAETKVRAMVADAMRHQSPDGEKYTHAVMQFALSHFDADGKSYLLDHLMDIMDLSHDFENNSYCTRNEMADPPWLTRNGWLTITDEFLPAYHDADSEKEALWKHHGAVIFDALIKGNSQLAQLELEALYSGLHKIGDHKIPCEEFEDMLWEKGLSFRKFKTFPLVKGTQPDLVPFNPKHPPTGVTLAERKANGLWQKNSREIFNLITDPKTTGTHVPLPHTAREKLAKLGRLFQTEGVDTLRPTPKPDDVKLDYEQATKEYMVKDSENEDNWGVYTYQIARGGKYHYDSMQRFANAIETARTPEEAGRMLYENMGKSCMPEVLTALGLIQTPANRWYLARGEKRPGYHALQNPQVRDQWNAKVDFTKDALTHYARIYYRESPSQNTYPGTALMTGINRNIMGDAVTNLDGEGPLQFK